MKILIISDTHGNHELLHDVLSANQDCEYLIHLGDEPDDLDSHLDLTENMEIFSVYGLYHQLWSERMASKSFTINGQDFYITHSKQYLRIKNDNCIYCFGHTHHRYFSRKDDVVLINPGHLKNESDRGETAGYAIIELTDRRKARFFNYNHEEIEEIKF